MDDIAELWRAIFITEYTAARTKSASHTTTPVCSACREAQDAAYQSIAMYREWLSVRPDPKS